MTSVAARSILGLSFLLAAAVGCDDSSSSDTPSGPGLPGTGGGNSTGTGGETSGTGGETTAPPEGIPLTIMDGWVDGASNDAGIVGAIFPYADPTTKATITDIDTPYVGAKACIKGEAAMVDTACTVTAEDMALGAYDCYGKYWGAAIGLNLNQPIDPNTMEGVEVPMPYDASALKGFGFFIDGANVPVPSALRFKVEDANGEYCTGAEVEVKSGYNTINFDQLFARCWYATPNATDPDAGRGGNPPLTGLVKIAWAVVTNATATVPFDFCVSEVVAIPK